MRIIHDKSYTVAERVKFAPFIVQNILDSTIRLAGEMKLFNLTFQSSQNNENLVFLVSCQENVKAGDFSFWTKNIAQIKVAVQAIWFDHSFRTCFTKVNFYLSDSVQL